MTIGVTRTLLCDGNECYAYVEYGYNAEKTRKEATKDGWHRDKGRDLCPSCWAKRQEAPRC